MTPQIEAQAATPDTKRSRQRIGRYEIEAYAGPRHPFDVYRAYDPQLRREVAVKIMSPQFAANDEYRMLVRHEVELIAALEHPNIVQVYDFGEYQGQPYIVMPFLTDGTLAARLSKGPLPLQQLAPIVECIAEALDAAHSQGVIHRQLRPENILLDAQGRAYLLDFGVSSTSEIAATFAEQGLSQTMAKYVSPEQAQALQSGTEVELTGLSDIYALGIILFEALTGQAPYQAETAYQTAIARLTSLPPQLHTANPGLPEVYQAIIDQALARNPAGRYRTAAKLASHVKEVASGRWYLHLISKHASPEPVEPTAKPQVKKSLPPTPRSYSKIGRYQVERQLGRGGMARVYLAHDPQINRQVAIKVMAHRRMADPNFRERFHHEAQLVATLKHEAIVTVYDYGEHQGQPFIVMQYLPGGTLADKLEGGPMRLRVLVPIIERLAAALDSAYAQNIVHQDLKPANIIFDAANQSFLSDFGIASLFDPVSNLGADHFVGGTPEYMSPEQARAVIDKTPKSLDGRSDIYSLGVVLFRALTGQVPYRTNQPRQTALAHLTESVPRISKIKPSLPAECQEIIDRVMAKDPTGRYQTAQDLAQDVKDLASGRWFWHQITV